MQVNDAMVRAASEAMKQRRRDEIERGRERATYEQMASLALTAAMAELWQDIETADKPDQKWGQPIIRLWDGERERHGYWDTNAFAKKPRPYWHYVDSIAVSDDRAKQPTHWAPLLPAPPKRDNP